MSTESLNLNPKTSALLSLDCQNGIVNLVQGADRILPAAAQVLKAARAAKLPVMHVGLGFRPGHPEISPSHPTFSAMRGSDRFVTGTDSARFHEAVAPIAGEITIAKHRVSAFSGNDLEMILRAQGITTLILFGIATSGIVLSTLRQAADMDYRCVVIEDCCFDRDEEVHRVLTQKVFARQATVITAAEFCELLKNN